MNITLPEMTVEQRDSQFAHGIPAPDTSMLDEQLTETIILNNEAKEPGWSYDALALLEKYVDADGEKIVSSVKSVTGYTSWNEVTVFVQDDMCLDFFNMALAYCLREGQAHQRSRDFIDGSGIGYVKAYIRRLKETLEQCFDAKYFYRLARPLEYAESKGLADLKIVANHIHPGHWSYPAGHGTKFLTAVEVLAEVFHLDKGCLDELLVAAKVLSMGRSGSLIHYPMDNLAGIHLVNL